MILTSLIAVGPLSDIWPELDELDEATRTATVAELAEALEGATGVSISETARQGAVEESVIPVEAEAVETVAAAAAWLGGKGSLEGFDPEADPIDSDEFLGYWEDDAVRAVFGHAMALAEAELTVFLPGDFEAPVGVTVVEDEAGDDAEDGEASRDDHDHGEDHVEDDDEDEVVVGSLPRLLDALSKLATYLGLPAEPGDAAEVELDPEDPMSPAAWALVLLREQGDAALALGLPLAIGVVFLDEDEDEGEGAGDEA